MESCDTAAYSLVVFPPKLLFALLEPYGYGTLQLFDSSDFAFIFLQAPTVCRRSLVQTVHLVTGTLHHRLGAQVSRITPGRPIRVARK